MKGNHYIILIVFLFLMTGILYPEQTISILYFRNTTGNEEYAWLSIGLTDMLLTDISATGKLIVVEREELDRIIQEQELSVSGLTRETDALKLGNLLNANRLVMGSFIVQEKDIRIDARIVNSESGKIVNSSNIKGSIDDIFGVEKRLAADLFSALGIESKAIFRKAETISVPAAKAYYTGLELLNSGKAKEALKLFEQAATLDPFYFKPQKSIEESYIFLKDYKKMQKQREMNKLYNKVLGLKKRIEAVPFYSFGDVAGNPEKYGYKQSDLSKLSESDPALFLGDTQAQCMWHLCMTLIEIADKSEEYFGDTAKKRLLLNEVLSITADSRTTFSKDPFLPEILYQELFAYRYLDKWNELKEACEYIMLTYPDFRMMYGVENMYELSLEKLKN